MSQTICYCFEYTVEDIQQDVREHQGQSTILSQIVAAKKQNGCHCASKHPESR